MGIVNINKNFRVFMSFMTGILCVLQVACAQTNSENDITAAFKNYRSRFIQEKLFVHTDKDYYLSREILWFRIYYTDAFYGKPAAISKIAYVELLDQNNVPVVQQKVSLTPGESNGSFIIPVNLPSGTYRFRAYTNWMKNFSPDYYFEKPICIVNPQNLQTEIAPAKTKHYDIQFFPEGGNLVQQIESKVAFRVTDAYGRGLDFEGTLLNATEDTLLKFHPASMGLGNFLFTPKPNQSYKAIIRFPQGEQITKDLPASYPDGYVLRLLRKEEQIEISVKSSGSLNSQDLYLFVNGSHAYLPVQKQKLINQQASFNINTNDLEEGISKFTLFDHSGQPVCERLYFKRPVNKLAINIQSNPEYKTREKINLQLSVAGESDQTDTADLSLAVYRLDSLQRPDAMNIRNYFYLGSELGTIENPGFYFTDSAKSGETDVDNLMLTHGWRRFIWKELLENKPVVLNFPPEYRGHILQGKLVNNNTGAPVPGIGTYLSVPSARTEFRVTTSDSTGHVKFEIPGFYGSEEIIFQTNPKEDSTCHVEITNPFSDKYVQTPLPLFTAPSVKSASLLDLSIAEQVHHIYGRDNLSQFSMQRIDTNTFYVEPDEKYYLDNYVRFQTMEEVIREYVVSTNVVQKRNKFQLYLANKPQREFFDDEPLILIDGVPFFDANELFQQDPMKIRRLDLMNREYSLGYRYFSGIVNVTTYHGDLNGILMNSHPVVLDYPGIPEQREFFSPAYETEDQVNSRMPDYRTLLYWTPQIISDFKNKKDISFYSSDLPGKYVAVIMGLSKNGQTGSQVIFFEVKK
jgi:hypothetical protein